MKKLGISIFAVFIFTASSFGQTVQELLNRGNQFHKNKQCEDVISNFPPAIRLMPNAPEPWFNRNQGYYYSGIYDAAVSDYSKAFSLKPKHLDAVFQRGLSYDQKVNNDSMAQSHGNLQLTKFA